jgi:GAF domain-containing protein
MSPDKDIPALLYQVAKKLRSARSLSELLGYLVGILRDSFATDVVSIWSFSKAQEIATCAAYQGPSKEHFEGKKVKLGDGVVGEFLKNQREVWVTPEDDPENLIPRFSKEHGLRVSFLSCMPLRGQDELLGAVIISHRSRYKQDQQTKNMSFFRKLSEDSAQALEDIANREQLAKRIRDLSTLSEIGTELSASLDLEKVLNAIVLNIMGHFIVEQVAILLLDDRHERLVPVQSRGLPDEVSNLDFSTEDELASLLIQAQRPVFLELVEDSGVSSEEQKRLEELGAALLLPIFYQEEFLGFFSVGKKVTEETYDEADLEFLSTVASQAGIAIKNAMLFEAERKANELSLLLEISKEITGTLDLDRVMHAFVNLSSQVIDYDRASVALFRGENLRLSAVSGQEKVDRKAQDMKALEDLLTRVVKQKRSIYVTSLEGEIQAENEETKARLKEYFEISQKKSFLAVPLLDEEGNLGAASMESEAPNFLTESSLEVIEILSNQLTVAVRNAELYQKVPLAKIIHPIAAKKRAILRIPRKKLSTIAAVTALVLALLFFWRGEVKVTCPVEIWPEKTYTITAEVDGIIEDILVKEGENVRPGQVLAKLHNDYISSQVNHVKAWLESSRGNARSFFAASKTSQYQIERNQIEKLEAELSLLEAEQEKTRIVSPASATILTPVLHERVGELLEKGDFFCELADLTQMRAEIQFPESDIHLANKGQKVKLLISAFPEKTFWGFADRVSSSANFENDRAYFLMLVEMQNDDGLLRPGMTGHAKVYCGGKSLGYVIFRKPGRLLRQLAWRLFGL